MTKIKTLEKINQYKDLKSDFCDYVYFEGDPVFRSNERDAFLDDTITVPSYDYPKLDGLNDNEQIHNEKIDIYRAILDLKQARENSGSLLSEIKLFENSLMLRLKRILLVLAAGKLRDPLSIARFDTSAENFKRLNESIYGKIDKNTFFSMIKSEINRANSLKPKTELAKQIKNDLRGTYSGMKFSSGKEGPLLSKAQMKKLHDFVQKKYAKILNAVPNTSDSKYYDASKCVDIINKTLKIGGLAEKGWVAVIDPSALFPNTAGKSKRINLPVDTKRNASELRRLIMHEQEVHARRAQDGEDSGLRMLNRGTGDYLGIEEGLGVLLECAIDGNFESASYERARMRYITAGLAIGIDSQPRDAREVYEILWRIIALRDSKDGKITDEDVEESKSKAYDHVENAYRGTRFWMKGVIFMKLKIYYEGLKKNAEYFSKNIDNLDKIFDEHLFVGKYNHTSAKERKLVANIIS